MRYSMIHVSDCAESVGLFYPFYDPAYARIEEASIALVTSKFGGAEWSFPSINIRYGQIIN